MLIPVYNPELDDLEKSFLANDYAPGAQLITVKNSDRFVTNDRIMIGEQGQEKTEVVTVTSPVTGGTDLNIGATVYPHSSDDPVYKLRFDTVRFYRSTTTATGPWTKISDQPLDVDNADMETKYDDVTGTAAFYYYFTFFHSLLLIESANSDVIGGGGWRREQVGHIIDEILQEVSDPQEMNISRAEILGYFNDVNDDLTIDNTKPPEFLKTMTTLDRTAGARAVPYPVDQYGKSLMWKFYRMDYNFTDATTNPTTDNTKTILKADLDDFQNRYPDNVVNTTNTSDAKPAQMALDPFSDEFLFSHPFLTSASDVLELRYWKYFNVIDSEGDIIETPTPKIYKLYIKAIYYRKRAITNNAFQSTSDRWMADYTLEKGKYKGHNRIDKGTPRNFRPQSRTSSRYRQR